MHSPPTRLVIPPTVSIETVDDVQVNAPVPAFDPEAALERVEGDRDFLRELLQLFGKQSSTAMAEITEAARRRDGPALERAAHKFKGSVGSFAAEAAFRTTSELETNARNGSFADVDTLCVRLSREVEGLCAELTEFTREVGRCES